MTGAASNPSGSGDIEDGFKCTDEDEEMLNDFLHNCKTHSTPVMLHKLNNLLSKAAIMVGDGKAMNLVVFCKALPDAILECLDRKVVAELHPNQEEFRAQVFEVLSRFVDFTVTFLWAFVGDPSTQSLMLPCLKDVLSAMDIALGTEWQFYSMPRENSTSEILVLPSRLECALQVPGYLVKVFGDTNRKAHYFCSLQGRNQIGATCECCTRPLEVDAVFVNICCQLAKTTCGSGYECLLKILCTYEAPSLELMNLLLRPFVPVLERSIKDKASWDVVLEHVGGNFIETGGMMEICHNAYQKVFEYLRNAVNLDVQSIIISRIPFTETVIHLHTIRSWSVVYPRSCADNIILSFDAPDQLLTLFMERIMGRGQIDLLCRFFQGFICARRIYDSGHLLPFVKSILQWLKEKKQESLVVRKLLLDDTTILLHEETIKFVEFVGKEGLVLQQQDLVAIINRHILPEIEPQQEPQQTLDKRYARAQIGAAILKNFNLDTFIPKYMKLVCLWLERWQAEDSVITIHMMVYILEKLIICDKGRDWRNRLLQLLWNQACKLPACEFVGCLKKIASHYSFVSETDISFQAGEWTENFLQACSSADDESIDSRDMGIKFEEKAAFEQRAKVYQDMEVNYNFETSLQLKHVLNIDIPLFSYETSKECLKRLGQSQQLMSGLKTAPHKHVETIMSKVVAPELRALEAVKKEMALRVELRQRMQDANARHLKEYDAMKQEHYKTVEKFLQECLQEKKEIVKDALYAKAKVIAAVELANLNPVAELSVDDILTRILQKTEATLEEVEANHKKSLERVPNSECNVCFVEFSLKRKRACFDPCGHTGTCMDCGKGEWKRTKRCPLCKSETVEPVVIPSMLFFG